MPVFLGYKPYEHQKEVHDAITEHIRVNKRLSHAFQKVFTVLSRRQVGKSLMAYNELLRFSINLKKSRNFYIAPTYSLSRKTFDEILSAIRDSGIVKSHNSTRLIINIINGGQIKMFSAEQGDNIRGETCSGIMVIDEAAFIRDKFYTEVAQPLTDAKKALTLITSTPRFKEGFFYKSYINGLNENDIYHESFSFMDHDLSHIISHERLEYVRQNVPVQTFKSEYLGQFIDNESMVFGDIDKIMYPGDAFFKTIHLGIDWATGSGADETVITGFNENGHMCLLNRIKHMEPVEQIETITSIINDLKEKCTVSSVTVEKNSIGSIYYDMLKKAVDVRVNEFMTTNSSKRDIVEKMQVAIQKDEVLLINDTELKKQFQYFEQNFNEKTKIITFGAPAGMHDDIVMSTLIAYYSYSKNKVSRFYIKK